MGSWHLNASTNELTWSDEAYRIFGLPTGKRVSLDDFISAIHPDDKEKVVAAWQSATEGEPYDIEHRILTRDGEKWLREQAELVFDANGFFLAAHGAVQDITKSKLAEQAVLESRNAAEAAAKTMSDFLSNMSHELRTPMHAILSFSDLGLKRLNEGNTEKLEIFLSRIKQSGTRLLVLLNDLLDLAKLEAGRMEMVPKPANMGRITESCLAEQGARLEEKQLSIALDIDPEVSEEYFDPVRIGQVIMNLLSNAIRFSPRGGKIAIAIVRTSQGASVAKTDTDSAKLMFSISDQGVGIPQEEFETVFDKFIQSSKTATGAGGTGLGLTISREIIEAHGGSIWAENSPTGGAVFCFVIPCHES